MWTFFTFEDILDSKMSNILKIKPAESIYRKYIKGGESSWKQKKIWVGYHPLELSVNFMKKNKDDQRPVEV